MTARHRAPLGLRAVAMVEGAKGLLVLLIGLGLTTLLNPRARAIAEELVRFAHIDSILHRPRFLIDFMARHSDRTFAALVITALLYIALRFAESFGRGYRWAEWLAAGSGAIYLPFEVFELVRRATLLKLAILSLNSLIVAYLLIILARRKPDGAGTG